MTRTLLIDLDDTLLNNDINTFLPGYMKALAKFLAPWVAPEKMAPQLLAATQKMLENKNPALTLEEVFDADFYPKLGVSKADLGDAIAQFYETVFTGLQSLTSPRPQAVAMVEAALEQGWQIVIATNPLFPRRAIEQRLAWAGLPVDRYPFALVTSYEHFHFAKPNPAYYAEILARLGWPNQTVAMLGNSLSDDLVPAAQLGIQCFWLTGENTSLPDGLPSLSRAGSLDQVIPWLAQIATVQPELSLTSPSAIDSILVSTPAVLDTLKRGSSAADWSKMPHPGEWCFTEIICHLRDSDREINLPRLERVFTEENAFIAGVNADAWSATRSYCAEDGDEAFSGFAAARMDLLQRLRAFDLADWQRQARHAIFGPTTLQELTSFVATHDRTHIMQAIQTLAAFNTA
jgi:FMN phosphatase YigB (HAD superfamily)